MNQKQTSEILTVVRSSHQSCSVTKGALRNFAKFMGKHQCQNLFFNKVAGLIPATLVKKRLLYSDDEEEGAEYKVKRISNSQWCVCSAKAVFSRWSLKWCQA